MVRESIFILLLFDVSLFTRSHCCCLTHVQGSDVFCPSSWPLFLWVQSYVLNFVSSLLNRKLCEVNLSHIDFLFALDYTYLTFSLPRLPLSFLYPSKNQTELHLSPRVLSAWFHPISLPLTPRYVLWGWYLGDFYVFPHVVSQAGCKGCSWGLLAKRLLMCGLTQV